MSIEFGDILSKTQQDISEKEFDRTPDNILRTITDSIEESDEINLQPIQINKLPYNMLDIAVGKEGQFKLASILPANIKFVMGNDFKINKPQGIISVPTENGALSKGLWFRTALAHEIGHSLDPQYDELDLQYKMQDDNFVQGAAEKANANLKMEVNAWTYGKSLADMMGIDEIHYEELVDFSLKAYFMDALEKIANTIDTQKDRYDGNIEIFNPITQDNEYLNVQDLRERIEVLSETNELYDASNKLKRVTHK